MFCSIILTETVLPTTLFTTVLPIATVRSDRPVYVELKAAAENQNNIKTIKNLKNGEDISSQRAILDGFSKTGNSRFKPTIFDNLRKKMTSFERLHEKYGLTLWLQKGFKTYDLMHITMQVECTGCFHHSQLI